MITDKDRKAAAFIDLQCTGAHGSFDQKQCAKIIADRVEEETSFLLKIISDIRQKTGVGDKPMLSELADAIVAHFSDASKMVGHEACRAWDEKAKYILAKHKSEEASHD